MMHEMRSWIVILARLWGSYVQVDHESKRLEVAPLWGQGCTKTEESQSLTFPDLPGYISCGYSTEEATNMAHEALHLFLDDISESEIPCPSKEEQISLDSNPKTFPITVLIVTKNLFSS